MRVEHIPCTTPERCAKDGVHRVRNFYSPPPFVAGKGDPAVSIERSKGVYGAASTPEHNESVKDRIGRRSASGPPGPQYEGLCSEAAHSVVPSRRNTKTDSQVVDMCEEAASTSALAGESTRPDNLEDGPGQTTPTKTIPEKGAVGCCFMQMSYSFCEGDAHLLGRG